VVSHLLQASCEPEILDFVSLFLIYKPHCHTQWTTSAVTDSLL